MSRGWDEIRLATTPDDLEKIYQFRYSVYVDEMNRQQPDADHALRRIKDKYDKTGFNFIALSAGSVVGTARVNFSRNGDLGFYEKLLGMASVGSDHPAATVVVTRLMVRSDLRSGTLAIRLACACFDLTIREGAWWGFIDCNDHLISFFSGLGFVAHMGKVLHPDYGLVTPMILDCRDEQHLRESQSPFLKILRTRKAGAI